MLTCLTLLTQLFSICSTVRSYTLWMKQPATVSLTAHQRIPECFTDLRDLQKNHNNRLLLYLKESDKIRTTVLHFCATSKLTLLNRHIYF